MRQINDRMNTDRGLTLIELAVAILVLAIGSIAAIRAADQSRLAIGGETPRLLARVAARNRIEELQLYGPTARLPETVTLGGQTFLLSTQSATTEAGLVRLVVRARSDTGEGAQLVAYLARGPR